MNRLQTIKEWSQDQDFYYLKSDSIVEQIEHKGRTFYSKLTRVDKPLDDEILDKHYSQEVTLLVPVVKHNESKYIFFLYDGDEPERFRYLFDHLMSNQGISTYQQYKGVDKSQTVAALKLPKQSISNLHMYANDISKILEKLIVRNWKIIPDPTLPESYNSIEVPYIN